MRAGRFSARLAWFPLAGALASAACVRPVVPSAGPAGPAVDPLGGCAVADLPPPRLWRLTQSQLRNTLQDLFGFSAVAVEALPAESRLEGYANHADGLGVPPLLMDHYNTIAEEMAGGAVRRSGQLAALRPGPLGRGSCLRDFMVRFGTRVWRRPLTEAEIGRLRGVYTTAAEATDPANGLRSLIKALLLSPNFLFRSELGTGPGPDGIIRLGDFELAAALSYLLWDTTPDQTLLAWRTPGGSATRRCAGRRPQRLLATLAAGGPRRSGPSCASG